MTVKELIKELSEMPQDLPVVSDFKEVSKVIFDELYYFNESDERTYEAGQAIVLE